MNNTEFIGINEIMELTGAGRGLAKRYAHECGLALPRVPRGPWVVPKQAFIEWLNSRKDER